MVDKIKFNWLILSVITLHPIIACAKSANDFIIGVENIEYLPYYDGSDRQDSHYHGFSEQLLTLFARNNGYNFDFYSLPINRLYKDFINKDYIDFKYPDNPQWHQAEKALYLDSKPVVYSNSILTTVTGIASLKNNIVLSDCSNFAKVRGFTSQSYQTYFNKKTILMSETVNTDELISLLVLKRVDCIYISYDVLRYKLKNEFVRAPVVYFQNQFAVDEQNFYLSSIKHPEIITQFNEFLKTHRLEIDALKQQFLIDTIR